ncbi:MAG: hemolysin family protein [Propionibacteriaceae bacterium]|jgi:putative hemolysin|nr:hemolysin family protein [Propionibacteriaceae bacterium]
MSNVGVTIAVVALLIIVGGVFAASEMALVSLRESQIKHLAGQGRRGQKVAALTANPNRFLSAIQVGITLTGFLAAAFGGDNLAEYVAPVLTRAGLPESVASTIATILVTIVISYFSIVIGELTAKRLAMQRAEAFALTLGGFVDVMATLARPVIWFLGVSTNIVVRLLGGDPKASREEVTDEELRAMVTGSASLGDEERHIVEEVFAAGERSLREVMVPRTEVTFLDGDMPAYKAITAVESAPHSRYPVTGRSVDDIVGFLHVRDLMGLDPTGRQAPIRQLARPVTALPATVKVLHALTQLRRDSAHLAIVRDEYGGTAGIVTLEDLIEELIGEIRDEYDADVPIVKASGIGLDVEGLVTLEQFRDLTGYILPEGPYDTLAGFWVACQGDLPELGATVHTVLARAGTPEEVEGEPVALTVSELDGRRAARINVRVVDVRGDATPSVAPASPTPSNHSSD